VIHARAEWELPTMPVTGPFRFDPQPISHIVVHYGAVPWPEERLRDSKRYWRDTQAYYVQSQGYSIGYQWGVGRDGSLWELRGADFRNAANSSTWSGAPVKFPGNPNLSTVSIHVILPMDGTLAPGQLEGVQRMVGHIWSVLGRQVPVIPHSDVTRTTCPGDPMRALIRSDAVLPTAPPPPPPPPITPPGAATVDDFIEYVTYPGSKVPAVFARWRSGFKTWMGDPEMFQAHQRLVAAEGKSTTIRTVTDVHTFRALGFVFGPVHPAHDDWGV